MLTHVTTWTDLEDIGLNEAEKTANRVKNALS